MEFEPQAFGLRECTKTNVFAGVRILLMLRYVFDVCRSSWDDFFIILGALETSMEFIDFHINPGFTKKILPPARGVVIWTPVAF